MNMHKADFNQLIKVLDRKTPDRPVLFEFFLNMPLYDLLSKPEFEDQDMKQHFKDNCINPILATVFHKIGYDYVPVHACNMKFKKEELQTKSTRSLNANFMITDRHSFNEFQWPNPEDQDYSGLQKAKDYLPDGMKLVVYGPGGVLENVIKLLGYENLCMMLLDDRKLAGEVFENVGERMVAYYKNACVYDTVGACISNDDWGFKTQTMLSPSDLREFVIPWHKKIADTIHQTNRPVIFHCCGKLDEVIDDIINVIGYDGKHSYEDIICPVEQMYDKYSDRIAIIGGIDVGFICSSTPQKISERSKGMIDKTSKKGSYALGTGNSVPDYVPAQNYFTMVNAARIARDMKPLEF
jgi:uroporphyrinogen decarboxylase